MARIKQYSGVGRRKRAIARIYLQKGNGEYIINGKSPEHFFDTEFQLQSFYSPLTVTKKTKAINLRVNAKGGGKNGLAQACTLGIARALVELDKELRPLLREKKMLSRDSRVVERKKYGQPGARRKFQFSKR